MRINKIVSTALFLAMLFMLTSVVNKGFTVNGEITIQGKIFDENGNNVKGLKVWFAYVVDRAITKEILTDEDGEYKFDNLKSGSYDLYVENPDDIETPLLVPEKHAFNGPPDMPYLYKNIKIKDTDTIVVTDFQLILGVKIEGKIAYEDGAPAKGIIIRSQNGWGTEGHSEEDGYYMVKGLLAENNTVTLDIKYDPSDMNLPTSHITHIKKTIGVTPGATLKKDFQIKKLDQAKIFLKGNVYVEGVLYDSQNSVFLENNKFPPPATPVFFTLNNIDETYSYSTRMLSGGKYEFYNILDGRCKLTAVYYFDETYSSRKGWRKGPITGNTEVEITADNTPVTIDINFVVSPTERVEFIRR